jgi:hypothetical protein
MYVKRVPNTSVPVVERWLSLALAAVLMLLPQRPSQQRMRDDLC